MCVELSLEDHMQLWNHAQVQLIDARLCTTEVEISFSMPSSGFIFAADNVQCIEFADIRYSEPADLVLHGGEGTAVRIVPRAAHAQFYLLLYRSDWPERLESRWSMLAARAQLDRQVSAVRATPETEMRTLLHKVSGKWNKQLASAQLEAKAYYLSFVCEWVRLLHRQAHRPDQGQRLSQPRPSADCINDVIEYMKRWYAQPTTLAQLAQLVNYSIPHLCSRFKETTGYTPIEYLTRLRIEAAKSLLASSALSLSAVAEQVGYRDPYYFGRLFKRLVGVSPMKYKRTAQDKLTHPAADSRTAAMELPEWSPLLFKRPMLRFVEHALGEAELPAVPRRIVALDWTMAEYLLALGITPTGVAQLDGMRDWVSLPIVIPDNIADVGPRIEPNLQTIAELSPDLIIGTRTLTEPFYESLRQIAPTVAYDVFPAPPDTSEYNALELSFRHLSAILDRESLAAAIQRRLDDSYADLRGYIRSAGVAPGKVMLAFGYSQQQRSLLRLSNDGSLSVGVIERLGLSNAYQPGHYVPQGFTTVGIEDLDVGDNAHMMYVVQRDDTITLNRLQQQRGWNRLHYASSRRRDVARRGIIWPYGGPLSVSLLAVTAARSLVQKQSHSR